MGSWGLRRQAEKAAGVHPENSNQRRAAEPPFGRSSPWVGRWPFSGLLPSWKADGKAGVPAHPLL